MRLLGRHGPQLFQIVNIDQFWHSVNREVRFVLLQILLRAKRLLFLVSIAGINSRGLVVYTLNSHGFCLLLRRHLLDGDAVGLATLLPVVEKRVLVQVSRVVIHGTPVHRISFVNGLAGQFGRFLEVVQLLRQLGRFCLYCVSTVVLVGEWLLRALPELLLVRLSVG